MNKPSTNQGRAEYASPLTEIVKVSVEQTVLAGSPYTTDVIGTIDEIE